MSNNNMDRDFQNTRTNTRSDVVELQRRFMKFPFPDTFGGVVEEFTKAFHTKMRQQEGEFFYPFTEYVQMSGEDDRWVTAGLRTIERWNEEYGWNKHMSTFTSLTNVYLHNLLLLDNALVVGVDMETAGYPTALYTRSLRILKELSAYNMLEGNIESVVKGLVGNKTVLGLQNKTLVTARLDFKGFDSGTAKPRFKVVIPRSNLEAGYDERFVLLPLNFMFIFDELLKVYGKPTPLSVEHGSDKGYSYLKVATSKDVTAKVYDWLSKDELMDKLDLTVVGYDPYMQQYHAYDLESSYNATSRISFRPEMLDNIKPAKFSDINTSMHKVDINVLRAVFKTRVMSAKVGQLDALNGFNLTSYPNGDQKREALIDYSYKVRTRDLYMFMSINPDVFGDVADALEAREKQIPRFLKEMTRVDIDGMTPDQLKNFISTEAKKGVIKLSLVTMKGVAYTRHISNKFDILKRMLGNDYIAEFETPKVRLNYVKHLINSGEVKNRSDLEYVAVKYNLIPYLDMFDFYTDEGKGDMTVPLEAINEAIGKLKEDYQSASYTNGGYRFPVRNIYATSEKNFYSYVDVRDIQSVYVSKV